MKPKDLSEFAHSLFEGVLLWGRSLARPVFVMEDFWTREEPKKHALKLWFSSFLLVLIVEAPVGNLFGIGLSNWPFLLSTLLLALMSLLLGSLLVHGSLRVLKVDSDLETTFVAYSVVIAAPLPLAAIMVMPGRYRFLQILSENSKEKEFPEAIHALFNAEVSEFHVIYLFFVSVVLSAVAVAFMARLVRSLSERYDAEVWKVGAAVGFAVGGVVPLLLYIIFFLGLLNYYSYTRTG